MASLPDPRDYYASHSLVTDPRGFVDRLDEVAANLAAIKDAVHPLVFHYRGGGDWAENGIAPERIEEINTRYADDMFARLFAMADLPLGEDREARERMVGCCRDFTVLFVALARHHGIPARMRVGFASYFMEDWYLDHVVAEMWDADEQRWRLVDAELPAGYVAPDGDAIDPLDIQRDQFLTGPDAWNDCQEGQRDPERFVVHPTIDIPMLRSWAYLQHNLVQDLAALNKHEMVLWDVWGIDASEDLSDAQHALLHEVAAATEFEQQQRLFMHDELRVPPVVQSFSPENPFPPREVELRTGVGVNVIPTA